MNNVNDVNSMNAYLMVHADGRTEFLTTPGGALLTLEQLQRLVDGNIEHVRLADQVGGMVNEEGRILDPPLPDNARYPNLAGPVVIGLSADHDPEFRPLPEALLALALADALPGANEYLSRTRTLDEDLLPGEIFIPDERPCPVQLVATLPLAFPEPDSLPPGGLPPKWRTCWRCEAAAVAIECFRLLAGELGPIPAAEGTRSMEILRWLQVRYGCDMTVPVCPAHAQGQQGQAR